MKRRFIEDPIYGGSFLLQLGGSLNSAIAEYAKALKIEPWTRGEHLVRGHFSAINWHKGGVIWFPKRPNAATMAHEAFHAMYHVMVKVGMTLNDGSEEAFTYYLQWLIDEIEKFVRGR